MLRHYIVRQTFQHPAWDERDGLLYDVDATTKAEAVKAARDRAYLYGHTTGGLSWFKVISDLGPVSAED